MLFLSSVAIADESLQQMRSNEMRYLSNELTYPPAKQLSENIRLSLPAPDTSTSKAITDETLKKKSEIFQMSIIDVQLIKKYVQHNLHAIA
jgi:hypothetical protein